MSYVYCLTSPSGKSYVGQTINIKRRLCNYKRCDCKRQLKLYNALKKYGFENFKVVVLEECDRSELNEIESFYINYFGTILNGYNINDCGSYSRMTDLGKNKVSMSNTKRKVSDKTRLKMSQSQTGRTMSEETKIKIGSSNKGRKVSDDIKYKLSLCRKGQPMSEQCITKRTLTQRTKNENWGTEPLRNKSFFVRFKEKGRMVYKSGFLTIESARQWRDEQIKVQ